MKFRDLNTFVQDFWIFEHLGKAVNPNGPLDIWKFKKFHLQRTSGVGLVIPGRVQAACSGTVSFIAHIQHSVCTQSPFRGIWVIWVIIVSYSTLHVLEKERRAVSVCALHSHCGVEEWMGMNMPR